MVQLGDEHGGHAVQAGAFFVLHGLQHGQRIEAITRINNGRAVREAGQVAQHHAKTVVQRNRNTQAVRGRELHGFANEEAVVQDVAVRQRGALGEAGGAAGELDVDRVAGAQRAGNGFQPRVGRVPRSQQRREAQQARRFVGLARLIEPHHRAQMRQAGGLQRARLRRVQLRRQFTQHAQVVAGLEAGHGHQGLARHLVQGIVQLGHAVGRVDVDQNQTNLGGGQLHQQPLRVVMRPDADALARLQAQTQQGTGQLITRSLQRAVAVALVLVCADQRFVLGLARHHGVKKVAQRLLDQGHIGRAAGQAAGQGGRTQSVRGSWCHGNSPKWA